MLKSYNTILQADKQTIVCKPETGYELAVNSISISGGILGGYVDIYIGDFVMKHSIVANSKITFPFFISIPEGERIRALSNNSEVGISVSAEQFATDGGSVPVIPTPDPDNPDTPDIEPEEPEVPEIPEEPEEPEVPEIPEEPEEDLDSTALSFALADEYNISYGHIIYVKFTASGGKYYYNEWEELKIQYRIPGESEEWQNLTPSIIDGNNGEYQETLVFSVQTPSFSQKPLIQFKASKEFWQKVANEESSINVLLSTASSATGDKYTVNVSGNILSLIGFEKDIPPYAFRNLFANNTWLKGEISMPAEVIGEHACENMFANSSIDYVPTLETVKIVKQSGMENMFSGCTSDLVAKTTLSAELYDRALYGMFNNCNKLTNGIFVDYISPSDGSTSIDCLSRLYYGCSSLNKIKVYFSTWNESYTVDWVNGVSANGTFQKVESLPENFNVNAIPEGWSCENIEIPEDKTLNRWRQYLTLVAMEDNCKIVIPKGCYARRNSKYNNLIQITLFEDYRVIYNDISLAKKGDYIQLYYPNKTLKDTQIQITGKVAAKGNLKSMCGFKLHSVNGFKNFFLDCVDLVTAPDILGEEVGESEFYSCFAGCTGLVESPYFEPTIIKASGCNKMFAKCSGLIKTVSCNIKKFLGERCMYYMYEGCSNLQQCLMTFSAKYIPDECFASTFLNCYYLKNAFEINVDIVGAYGFNCCYQNCVSLTKAPKITVTNSVENGSFQAMYDGCNNIVEAEGIYVDNLPDDSCSFTFANCSKLVSMPVITAKTFGSSACNSIFRNCTSLVELKPLNVENFSGKLSFQYAFANTGVTNLNNNIFRNVKNSCNNTFYNTFSGCLALKSVDLFLDNSEMGVYLMSTFSGCSELETVNIELANPYGGNYLFSGTFADCSKINDVKVNFVSWGKKEGYDEQFFNNWLPNIGTSGIFRKPDVLPRIHGNACIPQFWSVEDYSLGEVEDTWNIPLTFTATEDNSTVKLKYLFTTSTNERFNNIYYRLIGATDWSLYEETETLESSASGITITLNKGESVQFQCLNEETFNSWLSNYYHFALTGKIKASGNIQSLMNYRLGLGTNGYCYLFANNPALLTAPNMPSIFLYSSRCYEGVYSGCTSLTEIPLLPFRDAGSSYSCYAMFAGCISLTKAELKVIDFGSSNNREQLSCIFENCSSLNEIKVYFNSWGGFSNTLGWVKGVSSTGTFYKINELLNTIAGTSRIPSGWTVINIY